MQSATFIFDALDDAGDARGQNTIVAGSPDMRHRSRSHLEIAFSLRPSTTGGLEGISSAE
jgi:hypothetical protein